MHTVSNVEMRCEHLPLGRKYLRLFATFAGLVCVILLVGWLNHETTRNNTIAEGNRRQKDDTFRDAFDREETFKHDERIKQMRDYCKKHPVNISAAEQLYLSNIIVSEKYKLVFCPVPKVACTVWKKLLAHLEGVDIVKDVHEETKYKLKSLKDYSLEERRSILQTYTKFMFVRDPFERLLSAYKDVFWGSYKLKDQFWQGYRKRVRKYLIQNGHSGIDLNVDNTTFEDFTTYVVLTKKNGEILQVHWRQMFDLCHPCYIEFDFIGHYETLSQDSEYFFRKTNLQDKVEFPSWRPSDTHRLIQEYYSRLTLIQIAQLYDVYKDDIEVFGYKFPGLLQPVIAKLINQ